MCANRDPNDLQGLKIVVREQGTTTAIELHGEWDLAGRQSVRQAMSRVLGDVPESIVLDLSPLRFIDSSGLHATIELTEHAAAHNTRLVIIPGPEPVQRLFEIAGIAERLPFIGEQPKGSRVPTPGSVQSGAADLPDSRLQPAAQVAHARRPAPRLAAFRPRPDQIRTPTPSARRRRGPGAGSRP